MIRTLLDGNRRFVTEVFEKDRDYFTDLGHGQNPTVLQIGCSDLRVPVNIITQTKAGEAFAHRNVCNIVATNDWNLSAVPEFSINRPHIPDIVVCCHYGSPHPHPRRGQQRRPPHPDLADQCPQGAGTCGTQAGASIWEIDPEACHRLIVDENVRLQLGHLQDYPFFVAVMKAGRLRLHGWVCDMGCGEIDIISGSENLKLSVRPQPALAAPKNQAVRTATNSSDTGRSAPR